MPKIFILLLVITALFASPKSKIPDSDRARTVRTSVWPKLKKELVAKGFKANTNIYLRIFKEHNVFEVWAKAGNQYKLFKTYKICFFSGTLGPKTESGDGQSPEGFYTIGTNQLNPVSTYHLAINVGYPNKRDALNGCTGDLIMVHGNCVSIGCFAMTDPQIDEIYTLVYQALSSGQTNINLDIFPFKLDAEHLRIYHDSPYLAFWKTMKPGYDFFERRHVPAVVGVRGKEYAFL